LTTRAAFLKIFLRFFRWDYKPNIRAEIPNGDAQNGQKPTCAMLAGSWEKRAAKGSFLTFLGRFDFFRM
jgi:hypothetical protein